MPLFSRLSSLLRNLTRRARVERDLDDEMRAVVELLVEEKIQAGLSPDRARRAALLELRAESVKTQVRDARAGAMLETLLQDVRYSARLLRRSPLFAATILASLTVGIGANTAVFSVVDAVLLREIQLPQSDELAVVWKGPVGGKPESGMAPATALELGERIPTAAAVVPFALTQFTWQDETDGDQVLAMRVGASFLATLHVRPRLGRDFTSADDAAGAQPVVILGNGLWKRRFGADPSIVGRTIDLNGQAHLVVGVMGDDFGFPEVFGAAVHPEIWTALRMPPQEANDRGARYVFAVLRRHSGTPWTVVQSELDALSRALERIQPRSYTGQRLQALPVYGQVVGNVRVVLLVLWAAVTGVLLAACANVGHMLMSRATDRWRELAIRTSLGATRRRLVQQLLVESCVLGCSGALLGFGLSVLTLQAWRATGVLELFPRAQEVVVNARVFAFACVAGLLTSALCGVVPALRLVSMRAQDALRRGPSSTRASHPVSALRAALVVCQIAAAMTLAIGAGLLVRSFAAVQRVDLGFNPQDLLTLDVSLPRLYTRQAANAFFDRLHDDLEALPQVSSAGAMSLLPLGRDRFTWTFLVRDQPLLSGRLPIADVRMATPGALETLGVALRSGRLFRATDRNDSQPVAIINESLARQVWPGVDPIGRELKLEGPVDVLPWMTVVGVVANVRFGSRERAAGPAIYRPYSQQWRTDMAVLLRAKGDPQSALVAARQVVRSIDPSVTSLRLHEFSYYLARSVAERRLYMTMLSLSAVITLALALVGVYGSLAYLVTFRTREIGVRVALGARRAQVMWTVIGPALRLTLLGVLIGLSGSIVTRRALREQLFSVAPSDPWTIVLVSLLVVLAAGLATVVPARRAAHVDPITALRAE